MRVVITKIEDNKLTRPESLQEVLIGDKICVLGIDASTSVTGMCLMELKTKTPLYSIALFKDDDEKNIRYKVRFKALLKDFFDANKNILYTIYEEPHLQYVQAAKTLLPLSTSIEELKIESEPDLDYLVDKMYDNKKWKKQFLGDDMPSSNTEAEKKAITEKAVSLFPFYAARYTKEKGKKDFAVFTQDERDAFGLAYVRCRELLGEIVFEKLPKQKPFKYEIEFIGASCLDAGLEAVANNIKYPESLAANGIKLCTLERGEDFDQKIYDNMEGEDKIIILEFPPSRAGKIVLKHRLGHLKEYEYIYAVVWRKSRKKVVKRV